MLGSFVEGGATRKTTLTSHPMEDLPHHLRPLFHDVVAGATSPLMHLHIAIAIGRAPDSTLACPVCALSAMLPPNGVASSPCQHGRDHSNPHSRSGLPNRVEAFRGFLYRGLYDACPPGAATPTLMRVWAGILQPLTRADITQLNCGLTCSITSKGSTTPNADLQPSAISARYNLKIYNRFNEYVCQI